MPHWLPLVVPLVFLKGVVHPKLIFTHSLLTTLLMEALLTFATSCNPSGVSGMERNIVDSLVKNMVSTLPFPDKLDVCLIQTLGSHHRIRMETYYLFPFLCCCFILFFSNSHLRAAGDGAGGETDGGRPAHVSHPIAVSLQLLILLPLAVFLSGGRK